MHKFYLQVHVMISLSGHNVTGEFRRTNGILINSNSPWWVKNPVLCR